MVCQPSDYLDLLDRIGSIEPAKDMAEQFAKLAAEPIKDNDALGLLLLAELAMRAREWQAAAQLFARVMVSPLQYSEADLVDHASRIILLTTQRQTDLHWTTDLLLYGHRRLTAALRADGIQQAQIDEWMVAAVSQLLRGSPDRTTAVRAALTELHPGNNRITRRYQSEIGPTRQLFARSLNLQSPESDPALVYEKGRIRNLVILTPVVIAIAALGYLFRSLFTFPEVSGFLDGGWGGSLLRATLVAWPLLLAATWFFALSESIRTCVLYVVSPYYLIRQQIVAGAITPFMRDWFFHIFQFVWVALLVMAWLLFQEYQTLPVWLPAVWSPAAQNTLTPFEQSLAWDAFVSDWIALALAAFACVRSVTKQQDIQKGRIETHTCAYWWDRRINVAEWRIRLFMVGLDIFLAIFLVVKILLMLLVVYTLVATNELTISYFSRDGVGGLRHLTNMLMYLTWIAFAFGIFVFASLYLHWNLREYRANDFVLVGFYVLFVILAVVPLGKLEYKLSGIKDAQLERLVNTTKDPEATLEDAAKYVNDVNAVRDWDVSAVKVGILGNPVLPLGFQFIVVLFQAAGRAGKVPKLPIPGFGEQGNSKGGHDAA